MANMTPSFEALQNASFFEAASEAYTSTFAFGDFFYPLLLAFFLILVYIKTESPAATTTGTILAVFTLANLMTSVITNPIFYTFLAFSVTLTFWSLFGSSKTDV